MAQTEKIIDTMRRFGRFYTVSLGTLDQNYLGTGFSVTEMRLIFEIDWYSGIRAAELAQKLRLDKSYISRIIRSFEKRGLITRTQSPTDGRTFALALTPAGKAASNALLAAVHQNISRLLAPLSEESQEEVAQAMERIMEIFEKESTT